jgi:hypothetical protein
VEAVREWVATDVGARRAAAFTPVAANALKVVERQVALEPGHEAHLACLPGWLRDDASWPPRSGQPLDDRRGGPPRGGVDRLLVANPGWLEG